MYTQSNQQSTEPPSFLKQGLDPVKLKYIALPVPVTKSTEDLVPIEATETMRMPCRRCLQDSKPGEKAYLMSYDPFPADSVTPYRGEGPIFIHTHDCRPFQGDKLPDTQLRRLLSLRAYDDKHMLAASQVVEGKDLEDVAGQMLADDKACYVNVHNALPGCFAARIERG